MCLFECCFSCSVEEGYIKLQVKLSKFATNCGTKGFDMLTFCFYNCTVQKNQTSNLFKLSILYKNYNELHIMYLLLTLWNNPIPRLVCCPDSSYTQTVTTTVI